MPKYLVDELDDAMDHVVPFHSMMMPDVVVAADDPYLTRVGGPDSAQGPVGGGVHGVHLRPFQNRTVMPSPTAQMRLASRPQTAVRSLVVGEAWVTQ